MSGHLESGIHPKVVQERLGHANVSITLDLYSHVSPAMQSDAAERVAALFVRPPATSADPAATERPRQAGDHFVTTRGKKREF